MGEPGRREENKSIPIIDMMVILIMRFSGYCLKRTPSWGIVDVAFNLYIDAIFFNHTLLGKALRATAINPTGALLQGIRISGLSVFCFGLTGALGAIAGIVISPITFTGYNIGLMTGLKGLIAAIVGGWTIAGTVIAGVGLGLVEGLFGGFVSPAWKDAIALLVMIVFLVIQTFSSSHSTKKV
jgi:branched-chain amino acid transport system permease protein